MKDRTAKKKLADGKKRGGRSGPHPRSARMREEIVWAAADAFARKGYRATTMQEIASGAGYTAASLYTYFSSKEEIYRALFDTLKQEFLTTFGDPIPAGLEFAQKLELLLIRQYEVSERRRSALTLLLQTAPDIAPEKLSPASDGHGVFVRRFAEWLEENAAKEDLGDTHTKDAATVLCAISHAVFVSWLTGDRKGRLTELAPLIVRQFLFGVTGARR